MNQIVLSLVHGPPHLKKTTFQVLRNNTDTNRPVVKPQPPCSQSRASSIINHSLVPEATLSMYLIEQALVEQWLL